MSSDRNTEAEDVELISDAQEKARRESENGIRQFKVAEEIVVESLRAADFRITQSMIMRLHEAALKGVHKLAGTYRNTHVRISESSHEPPHYHEVADHMADMCYYINSNWVDKNAIHLSAYAMWRLNWIHPFADGNGRTARTLSYVVLSMRLRSVLPGSPTIPDLIDADKGPYYKALEMGDHFWKEYQRASLETMENFLEELLAKQLRSAVEQAGI